MCVFTLGKNTCSISTYYHSKVRIARQKQSIVFFVRSQLCWLRTFCFDMEKKTEKLNKARVIKGIVIGALLVCVLVCSSVVALNWGLIDHAFSQTPDISSSETIDLTKTVQESTQKHKAIKQKKSKKIKKKSKKKSIEAPVYTYVLNTNTGRFHTEDCYYVDTIAEHNKRITQSTRE